MDRWWPLTSTLFSACSYNPDIQKNCWSWLKQQAACHVFLSECNEVTSHLGLRLGYMAAQYRSDNSKPELYTVFSCLQWIQCTQSSLLSSYSDLLFPIQEFYFSGREQSIRWPLSFLVSIICFHHLQIPLSWWVFFLTAPSPSFYDVYSSILLCGLFTLHVKFFIITFCCSEQAFHSSKADTFLCVLQKHADLLALLFIDWFSNTSLLIPLSKGVVSQ